MPIVINNNPKLGLWLCYENRGSTEREPFGLVAAELEETAVTLALELFRYQRNEIVRRLKAKHGKNWKRLDNVREFGDLTRRSVFVSAVDLLNVFVEE